MTDTRTCTFTEKLRESRYLLGDLVLDLSLRHLDLPNVLECPTRRWAWFADVLDHPLWGLAADVPALAALCDEAARLGRRTALGRDADTVAQQWRSLMRSVAIAHRSERSISESETLMLISDLAVDGVDHCGGRTVSGFEALLGYIATVRAVHGAAARQVLIRSIEWEPTECADTADAATG